MKTARLVIFAVVALFAGFRLFTFQFPAWFSHQKEISHEDLAGGGFYDRTEETGEFEGKAVSSYEIPPPKNLALILGENNGANKRIEVDLSSQRVYAFEGDKKIYDFTVSTGKWGRTPTGTFKIEYKTRAQKMSGGSRALNTYYYLPNVPFVQFFGNSEIPWSRGFSFHGTYWHSNFGYPMSHGCINMKTEDAETLYNWTTPTLGDKRTIKATADNPGTPVIIYGITPTG